MQTPRIHCCPNSVSRSGGASLEFQRSPAGINQQPAPRLPLFAAGEDRSSNPKKHSRQLEVEYEPIPRPSLSDTKEHGGSKPSKQNSASGRKWKWLLPTTSIPTHTQSVRTYVRDYSIYIISAGVTMTFATNLRTLDHVSAPLIAEAPLAVMEVGLQRGL